MISVNKPAAWEPLGGSDTERPAEKEKEPYRLAGSAEPCPRPSAFQSAGDHVPTVLIVEDDEPTRTAMAAWLAREGYLVLTAADGHEAAGHLERPLEPIDVAVLDVGLPDVDGIALCQRLRELYPTMPVVVCSGHATPTEVAQFLELGASRYFRKPVEPDELLAAVESLLP
jgi:two-component system, OmpR family, response regulator MprA